MRPRGILNLALVLVVAGLALLLFLRPGKETKPPPPEYPLSTIEPAQVKTIRIQAKGHDEARLSRGDGDSEWRLQEPVSVRADGSLIGSVLGDFGETTPTRYDVGDLDLSRYGLDEPSLKVWLNGSEFDFGDTNPLNSRRYIRAGQHVYLVADSLYRRLNVSPLTFAAKRLLPGKAEISAIHLPGFTVTRDDDGHWQAQPAPPNMAKGAPQQLVDAWQGVYAMRVSRSDGKDESGQDKHTRVSIDIDGRKQPLVFEAFAGDGEFLIARPDKGLVYHVSSGSREQMLTLATEKPEKKQQTRKDQTATGAAAESG